MQDACKSEQPGRPEELRHREQSAHRQYVGACQWLHDNSQVLSRAGEWAQGRAQSQADLAGKDQAEDCSFTETDRAECDFAEGLLTYRH
eukprot:1159221-Pelagomonas_calceolata.AAC.15